MDRKKLELWQRRLAESSAAFSRQEGQMDERERLYAGDRTLRPLVPGDHRRDGGPKSTSHVRNIVFENIESQVSSSIPQPKVTARRKKDEHLAETIEHFLRNELDRLPMEAINDLSERTVPIQGGTCFLVEWGEDDELSIRSIHPKQLAPQPGVYTGIEDMDWYILKIPTTKEAVRRRYGVSVADESESEPQVRGTGGEDAGKDAVTHFLGYAKHDRGGVDFYSWVNDIELEDLVDYQARRGSVCAACGERKPAEGGPCPVCGGAKWREEAQDSEELFVPVSNSAGALIGGAVPVVGTDGALTLEPARIPAYRPDRYPLVLQRSVSVYGQLLGNSDADLIKDQQNTVNRMEQKIIDRLVKAGTRITLPDRPELRMDPEDGERWFLPSPADTASIGVYNFSGSLEYEMAYLAQVYEEARQILGITDSFQGDRKSVV